MRRFLTGLGGSLLLLLLVYCLLTGLLGRHAVIIAATLVVGFNLLFFGVFRTGFNLRFADPSLTAAQLLAASATLFYVAYHAGPARPAFLFGVLTVFLFGVLRLRTRQLLAIALFDILIHAALIVWPLGAQGEAGPLIDLRLELLMLLMMMVSLTGFALMAGQIVALRSNVEGRNRELDDAVHKLKRRQQELSELQQLVQLGTWSRDWRDGTAVWSDVMYQMYGIDPAQPVPQREQVSALVHPQDRERYARYVDETDRSRSGGEIDLRITPRTGGVRWVRVQRHNILGADGALLRQYGTMLDITVAKQGERRLTMQHALTRVLAESASLGVALPQILRVMAEAQEWAAAACWRVAQDGLQLRCVDAWALDEAPLRDFSARQQDTRIALHPDRRGMLLRAWRSQRPHWVEDVMQDAQFNRRDAAGAANLHGAFVLPVVAAGRVLRVLEFYSHDARTPDTLLLELAQSLGNQIGQFIERRSAEAALSQAREHLDMAVKASGIGFWDFSIASGQTHYSAHVREMLGYDEASMPAGDAGFNGLVHPDERAALRAAHLAGIGHGKPYAMELRLRLRSGGWRWFRGRAQAFYDAGGKPVRVAGSLTDIEERKRIDRAKDEFVATVSHELRTPLTAIRGALGLLDGGVAGELPDDAKELVRVALSGSERLSRLVNDVLNLARIEAGATALTATAVTLDTLVAEAVSANQIYCSGVGVTLRAGGGTGGSRGAQLYADPDRLMQVLTNLISNAAKFSPAGSAVSVTSVRSGRRLRVNVIDHGSGIPASFRDRMFQKFSQVDSTDARAQQGSGLGLSICHALVTQMGGVIDFFSTAGGGTTFFVEFPEYDLERTQEHPAWKPAASVARAAVPPAAASAVLTAAATAATAATTPAKTAA